MLALTAFRTKVHRAEYREADDPETEIWRACQTFGTEVVLSLAAWGYVAPGCMLLIGDGVVHRYRWFCKEAERFAGLIAQSVSVETVRMRRAGERSDLSLPPPSCRCSLGPTDFCIIAICPSVRW
jgi:hypothetical protein